MKKRAPQTSPRDRTRSRVLKKTRPEPLSAEPIPSEKEEKKAEAPPAEPIPIEPVLSDEEKTLIAAIEAEGHALCVSPKYDMANKHVFLHNFNEVTQHRTRSGYVHVENSSCVATFDNIMKVLMFNMPFDSLFLEWSFYRDRALSLGDMLRCNTTITRLMLGRLSNTNNDAWRNILDGLHRHSMLRELGFTDSGMTGDHVHLLASTLPIMHELAVLDFRGAALAMSSVKWLLPVLPRMKRLVSLDLSGASLDGIIPSLAEALNQTPNLKSLSVGWCLRQQGLYDDEVRHTDDSNALVQLIEHNKTLTYLDVSGGQFGWDDSRPLADLRTTLCHNHTLRSLNLTAVCRPRTVDMAWEIVMRNDHLVDLSLSRCRLDNGDGLLLTKAIASNTRLRNLDLSHNELKGGQPWIVVFRLNCTLKNLDLHGNGFTTDDYAEMLSQVNTFTGLRYLKFGFCKRDNFFTADATTCDDLRRIYQVARGMTHLISFTLWVTGFNPGVVQARELEEEQLKPLLLKRAISHSEGVISREVVTQIAVPGVAQLIASYAIPPPDELLAYKPVMPLPRDGGWCSGCF